MELGLLSNLWANCALGATILTVPTLSGMAGIQTLPGMSAIPTIQTMPTIPILPTLLDPAMFQVPSITSHLAQLEEIEQLEKLEQVEQLDDFGDLEIKNDPTNFNNDEESQATSGYVASETDDSDDQDDYDEDKSSDDLVRNDANETVVNLLMLNMMKSQFETEKEDHEKREKKKKKSYQRIRYDREEYRCTLCPYSCTTERAFLKHLRSHAEEEKESGKACDLGEAPPRLSCPICGKDRNGAAFLNRHMEKHRIDKNFCCDICAFKTVQLKKLIQHRRMHTGERPHLCPHCSYRSARRDNLRSHVRRVHKRDDLSCDTFSPRGMLIRASSKVECKSEILQIVEEKDEKEKEQAVNTLGII